MYYPEIPFIDLKQQNDALHAEIMEAIAAVCHSSAFSGKPCVNVFEDAFRAFLGAEHFAGVSSGSDALFLALQALGVGAGDEVIVPANTFIATAFAAMRLGAVPVFADCDPITWQIDPDAVKTLLTEKTRAVIGVHLYGQAFPVDELREITQRNGLYLLEDCAQSQGTAFRGRTVGTLSDAGCFSFYPTKNLGAFGQAGGVASRDPAVDRRIRLAREQGSEKRYHHEVLGYNMRMDAIQAAVLTVKLSHLKAWNRRRSEIVRAYREGITNSALQFQGELPYTDPAWYLAVVCVPEREGFLRHMEDHGIHCGIHYPIPCHLQPVMKELGYHKGSLPHCEYLAEHCVSLPLFPELPDEDVQRVIDACNGYEK